MRLVYDVDRDAVICQLDEEWSCFAEQNDGLPAVHPSRVMGRPMWDFIRGDDLQQVYRLLFDWVLETGRPVDFSFRCDSPTIGRYMRMGMTRVEPSIVRFVSQMERSERRELPLCVIAAARGQYHVKRCSVCNLFRMPEGNWSDICDVVGIGLALDRDRPLRVLWSICESCSAKLKNSRFSGKP